MEWWDIAFGGTTILGQPMKTWAIALAVMAAAIALLLAFKKLVVVRIVRAAGKSKEEHAPARIVAGVLESTRSWFYVVVGIYVGSVPLALEGSEELALKRIVVLAVLVQVGIWCQVGLTLMVTRWRDRHIETSNAATAAAGVALVSRLVIWALIFTLALANLGIEISALVAGLGIGGIAAALAVQNVLSDLFASLSIYFDRPFDIGDFIIVDDLMGNVTRVGMRSTQVRSLSGEQLIFPNADLAKSRIKNYKRMYERRVVFSIGITYETPFEKVARVPRILREVVEDAGGVRFDRAHFQSYGDFSLNFEIVYYVLSPDYNVFMDTQPTINLALFERFEGEGIDFAYPTRTLHVHATAEGGPLVELVRGADGADNGHEGRGAPAPRATRKTGDIEARSSDGSVR
jgi:small-conductance mechanosensitive channel